MRMVEIASAEEQMALWKLINDNVWAAINQQARDEVERKAAEQRAAKLKGGKRKTKGATPSLRLPPPPPPKKAASTQQPQQKSAVSALQQPTRAAMLKQPSQPTALQQPMPLGQPSASAALAQPQALPSNPLKPPKSTAFLARNIAAAKKW